MMTPKLFKQQSLPEKLTLIHRFGTYVATRHFNHYQVQLHALDKMLVEVWYTRQLLWKQPVKVEIGLASDALLDPYLEMIRLNLDFD